MQLLGDVTTVVRCSDLRRFTINANPEVLEIYMYRLIDLCLGSLYGEREGYMPSGDSPFYKISQYSYEFAFSYST